MENVHNASFQLNIHDLLKELKQAQLEARKRRRMIESLGRPHLKVEYESLVGNINSTRVRATWGRVLAFLGVDPDDVGLLRSRYAQEITQSHRKTIRNYNEVKSVLRNFQGGVFLSLL